jgi:hypothetical protein
VPKHGAYRALAVSTTTLGTRGIGQQQTSD